MLLSRVLTAFLRTRIDNPLLCLTVSMTLRDKPARGIIAGFDLPVEKPAITPAPKVNRDHVSATDLEDVNLLDDFGQFISSPGSLAASIQRCLLIYVVRL